MKPAMDLNRPIFDFKQVRSIPVSYDYYQQYLRQFRQIPCLMGYIINDMIYIIHRNQIILPAAGAHISIPEFFDAAIFNPRDSSSDFGTIKGLSHRSATVLVSSGRE